MSSGPFFLLAFFGMFVGTVVLATYVYAGFKSGFWLGMRAPGTRPLWIGFLPIVFGWAPISLWPFLADWNTFLKAGVSMGFFILNAYPMCIGYGTARELRRAESKRRFRKNVDDWLGEWECEPATHGLDDEDFKG
jgi:hypothetical protein